MNIITYKKIETRLMDGINTLLSLDDTSFDAVIEGLSANQQSLERLSFHYTSDECENPSSDIQLGLETTIDSNGSFIGRGYWGEIISISEIFCILADRLETLEKGSKEHTRITRLLKTRDLEAFKSRILGGNEDNRALIDKVFEIVADEETFQRFLNYDNNRKYFSINGQEVEIGEYLKYLGKIFGNKDKNGNLSNDNTISKNFYIPHLETYKLRYSEIFDRINIDRYVNPTYEFRRFTTIQRLSNTIIRKGEEPDWTINPELYDAVFSDMPDNLSLEEQAIYIYCKLCKELSYDEGYLFRNHTNDKRYNPDFNQDHLESITPGSKITCWDFSRIFSKMVNGLSGDIEAVVIAEGVNHGHYLTGFYTDRVSVMLEAVNNRTGGLNDLTKSKNGIQFEGIEIISDRKGVIPQAVETIYPLVFGRSQSSLEDYIQTLKHLPNDDVPDILEIKLDSFIETMKQNNISGNEAIQTLTAYRHSGFFGDNLGIVYLGKKEFQNNRTFYRRMALIHPTFQRKPISPDDSLFLLDSDSLKLSICTTQEVLDKLQSGEYVYESYTHQLPETTIGG